MPGSGPEARVPRCRRHRWGPCAQTVIVSGWGETVVRQCRMAKLEQRWRWRGCESCMSVSWILKDDKVSLGVGVEKPEKGLLPPPLTITPP